jgi:hypothetical protein
MPLQVKVQSAACCCCRACAFAYAPASGCRLLLILCRVCAVRVACGIAWHVHTVKKARMLSQALKQGLVFVVVQGACNQATTTLCAGVLQNVIV